MGKLSTINEIIKAHIDVNKHIKICYFYIKSNNLKYDLILDRLWLNRNNVQIITKKKTIYFSLTDLYVKSTEGWLKKITSNIYKVNDAVYANWMRQTKKQDSGIKVFTVFITDIEKALHPKLNINPSMLLLEHYHHKLQLFQPSETEKLPLLWESDINHRIKFKQVNDKDSEASWKLLYNMLKKKLLILCKKFINLLNKEFICVSWFSAASPVLFIKKPKDDLWFCIDYKALNIIMKKNCYSLLLIHKTLN